MADIDEKYSDNVPGPYYVDTQCIDCDLCRETAPDNFTRQKDEGYSYVYKQPENFDESWSILKDKKNMNKILSEISDEEAEKYWNRRLSGKGKVYESNIINKFNNKNLETDINVIMLHVFRDSSFNFIDNERIFCDYIDWIPWVGEDHSDESYSRRRFSQNEICNY